MQRKRLDPGPDHPITVRPLAGVVTADFNGRRLAHSNKALALQEASYPVVYYIPVCDVDMAALTATDRATWCPYKGEAGYYSIAVDGAEAENAVWVYSEPFPAVAAIAGHLAFYRDKVDIEVRD